jgi:hypothetical protein
MKKVAQTVLIALVVLGLPGPARSADGWLLLVPPVDQEKLRSEAAEQSTYPMQAVVDATAGAFLLPMAPLRQWEQLHAFDTAAACEQWRGGLEEDAERHIRAVPRLEERGSGLSLEELLIFIRYSQGMESRCLPVPAVYSSKS